MISFLVTIIVISVLLNVVLFIIVNKKRRESIQTKRIYNDLHGETGLENVIKVLSKELSGRFKFESIFFFRGNASTMKLEAEKYTINMLEQSSAVWSFFNLRHKSTDILSEGDKKILEEMDQKKISFIPVQMKQEGPCWKIHSCKDKECRCYSTISKKCWIESEKHYKGRVLNTYNEKTKKCIKCKSFLPIGVFSVKHSSNKNLSKAYKFINNNFAGLLRDSVMYEIALHSAKIDSVTGVQNKRTMLDNLDNLFKLSDRYGLNLSFCMFDIDHFKIFNDTYGHQTGDLVLKGLAHLVSSSVRGTDIVARYGGEEFSIIFPNTEKDLAVEVAEKIREIVESNVLRCNKGDLKIRISMGVASYPNDDIENINELIKKADIALYQAKKTRNKVVAYDISYDAKTKK